MTLTLDFVDEYEDAVSGDYIAQVPVIPLERQ